jgi:glycosyltransferase involved in cell wall biosynthesis
MIGGMADSREPAPLRVCIDARLGTGVSGGVEQVVIGVAAALSTFTDGDEEYLFLTHAGLDDWIRPYMQGPCRILRTRRSRSNRRARAAVRAGLERLPGIGTRFAVRPSDGTVERNAIDVIHFPFQDAFTTSLPSIYQPHDLQHIHLPDLFTRWQWERREAIYRTHCERADTVVSMTSWGRRDLVASYGLAEEKVAVVPGGSVLADYPEPTEADVAALRERLALPERFLLYPAQTWPHKNHERLLEALALVGNRLEEPVPLVCTGGQTAALTGVQERAGALGLGESVTFAGFVSPLELRALYGMASALVFPSLFEGWGLPVCEAFSSGLPVAASTATCLPDVVGDAGLLFDPEDPGGISQAIELLWTDEGLRRDLAQKGRDRGERFTFEHTARLFRAHYRRVGGRLLSEEDRMLLAAPPLA